MRIFLPVLSCRHSLIDVFGMICITNHTRAYAANKVLIRNRSDLKVRLMSVHDLSYREVIHRLRNFYELDVSAYDAEMITTPASV